MVASFCALAFGQEKFCDDLQECMQMRDEYCQLIEVEKRKDEDKCMQARIEIAALRCEHGEKWACRRKQTLQNRYNCQKGDESACDITKAEI